MTTKSLINPRLLAILSLGFAGGLPPALTSSTLQAWFTNAQVNLLMIGAVSLIGLPYILKFLWAPIMDYYSFPRLGKRKGWILLMQLGLILAIFLLAQLNPESQASQMGFIALLIAFFSASQDVSINAYQTDILPTEERGLGAAYTVFGYRVASLVAGGLALIMADRIGWKLTYEFMAGLMFLFMVFSYFSPKPVEESVGTGSIWVATRDALADLLNREKIFMLLSLVVLYKIGDALALSLMSTFLLKGLGFSLTEVGLAYKIVSFAATVLGAFVGGWILTYWNIYRGLLVFGLAQAFSNLTFVMLALVGKNFALMAGSIFIENFCSGLSTAAFLAFLMSLCNHRFTATQFALLSALASVGRVFLGPLVAMLVAQLGWVDFYIVAFLLCFPGILCLIILKEEVASYAHEIIR